MDVIEAKSSPVYTSGFNIIDWTGKGTDSSEAINISDVWHYSSIAYKLSIAEAQEPFFLLSFD